MTPDEFASLLSLMMAGVFLAGVIGIAVWLRRLGNNMPPEILRYPPANDDWTDVFGQIPELPRPGERWTVRRKAAVIEAVRGGWVPIEEICALYNISVDELLAWERDMDRHGVHGLRTTRYQIYRDTDVQPGRSA